MIPKIALLAETLSKVTASAPLVRLTPTPLVLTTDALVIVNEPTLGAVHGDDFYFVANSHWNRFDRDNRLPQGLSGPIVLKLSLSE